MSRMQNIQITFEYATGYATLSVDIFGCQHVICVLASKTPLSNQGVF